MGPPKCTSPLKYMFPLNAHLCLNAHLHSTPQVHFGSTATMLLHLSHPELPPTQETGEESLLTALLTAGRGGGGGPALGPAPCWHFCSGAVLSELRAGYMGSHSRGWDAQCGAASLFLGVGAATAPRRARCFPITQSFGAKGRTFAHKDRGGRNPQQHPLLWLRDGDPPWCAAP